MDVNGSFRADDGGGSLDVSGGLSLSSGGFGSLRGTVDVAGGVSDLGAGVLLKRGLVFVSAVNTANATKYASRILFAPTTAGSNAVDVGTDVIATASITLSGSNIQITDPGNGSYAWSVTYAPLP